MVKLIKSGVRENLTFHFNSSEDLEELCTCGLNNFYKRRLIKMANYHFGSFILKVLHSILKFLRNISLIMNSAIVSQEKNRKRGSRETFSL